ncbi:hypothetical protein D3C87_518840 [compost metagenome]
MPPRSPQPKGSRALLRPDTDMIILTDEQILAQASAICGDIASGMSAVKACRKKGRVVRSTFMLWVQGDKLGIQALYKAAMKERAHTFAEQMIDIADAVKKGSSDEIQAAKLAIETRKWNAARMEPSVYGDRVRTELANADDKPLRLTTAQEMTDDQLAAIAAGSGGRASGQA